MTPLKGPVGDDTALGNVVGTVGYIAPESMYGELATAAVDQFALAVTACQLFTGVLPFPPAVDPVIAERLKKNELVPQELARVPRRLRRVLKRALNGDPSRRWPTMKAFCEALKPPPPASGRRWAIRIVAAIIIIPAYLVLLGYGLTRFAVETVIGACRGRAMTATLEVWPAARIGEVSARWGPKATAVAEAYVTRWRDASLGACFTRDVAPRSTRVVQAQVDCLDAALLGFDAKVRGLEEANATASEVDAQLRELDDPRACVSQWSGETPRSAPWPPP